MQPLLADRYAQLRDIGRVRERALFVSPRIPSELELQARWFTGDFGKHFVSTAGDKIEIVQFGVWNREAGPDFCDAAIRINGGKPIRGCIEIDLVDRNWEAHGHATNPAFEETVLHVFAEKSDREFFARTKSNRNVPQVWIDPKMLPDASGANLRHVAVRFCAGKKLAVALLGEHVEHSLFKCRIRRVPVRFPVAIDQIDLDTTANWFTPVDPNRSIAKIGSGFTIPNTKLDNLDLVAGVADKVFPKIPSKPARLQLQFRWNPRRDEQSPLANTTDIAELCVTISNQR